MTTTAQLKKIGQEKAASLGLVVIKYEEEIPGKTCRILVRKGAVILECHVILADTQTLVRDAQREYRAALITGVDLAMQSAKQFPLLSAALQKEIDSKLFGIDYIYL